MAPSTPPPPRSEEVAALTMASVVSLVMSAGPWKEMDLAEVITRRMEVTRSLNDGGFAYVPFMVQWRRARTMSKKNRGTRIDDFLKKENIFAARLQQNRHPRLGNLLLLHGLGKVARPRLP